jgi:hypothetical protein
MERSAGTARIHLKLARLCFAKTQQDICRAAIVLQELRFPMCNDWAAALGGMLTDRRNEDECAFLQSLKTVRDVAV